MWDSYDIDYHLTPNGWVTGTKSSFGKARTMIPRPADCVLTLRLSVRQTYASSRGEESWSEIWKSPSATKDYVSKLQKTFPRPS